MAIRTFLAASLLSLLASGCANADGQQSSLVVTPVGGSEQLPATLIRPDGSGPFPAVVIMHDCSGLGGRSSGAPGRWASFLLAQGYVVLMPDSFTPRGFPNGVCTVPGTDSRRTNGFVRAADAYGALAYLRTLPFVDGKHVGLMGGSHGGWTTLAAISDRGDAAGPVAAAQRDGFAAAVALYPACAVQYGAWSVTRGNGAPGPVTGYFGTSKPAAPLLILIGEKDDWTPAEPCRRLAEGARQAGYPLDIRIYAGAHHSFDSSAPTRYVAERSNGNSPTGRGATTGGDAAAWDDAKRQVTEFFRQRLREQPWTSGTAHTGRAAAPPSLTPPP